MPSYRIAVDDPPGFDSKLQLVVSVRAESFEEACAIVGEELEGLEDMGLQLQDFGRLTDVVLYVDPKGEHLLVDEED